MDGLQPHHPHQFRHWSRYKTEPDLRSLYEWLDTEFHRHAPGQEWGIWGGITGAVFGLAGGSMGMLGGLFHIDLETNPGLTVLPMVFAALVSCTAAVFTARTSRQRNAGRSEMRRTLNEARHFLWRLVAARRHGMVKEFLGESCALALNEGASHVLRCHRALRSVAWGSAEEQTEYSAIRNRVNNSMDLAMAKLVSHIGRGAEANDHDIRLLLDDMKATADEAIRTSTRLESEVGGLTPSTGLRAALSEMRLLNQTQDELEEFQREHQR